MLDPDITNVYNIPFMPKDKVFVRTGVHGDGSCFFHAFLRVVKPQYKCSSYRDRCKFVQQLREHLASQVTDENLAKVGKGEPRRLLFFTHLKELLQVSQNGSLSSSDLLSILEKTTTHEGNFYNAFYEKCREKAPTCANLKKWCYDLFITANDMLKKHYRNRLLNGDVSTLEIEFISQQLEYNFLFLHDVNGSCELYPFNTKIQDEWPFIVLLWKDECHYEIIGEMNYDRTITRRFSLRDEFISRLIQRLTV